MLKHADILCRLFMRAVPLNSTTGEVFLQSVSSLEICGPCQPIKKHFIILTSGRNRFAGIVNSTAEQLCTGYSACRLCRKTDVLQKQVKLSSTAVAPCPRCEPATFWLESQFHNDNSSCLLALRIGRQRQALSLLPLQSVLNVSLSFPLELMPAS